MTTPTTSSQKPTTLAPDVAAELDALIKPNIIPPLAADEFTAHTLKVRYGLNRDMVLKMIDDLVKSGRAEPVGQRRESRAPSQAWRLIMPPKKK